MENPLITITGKHILITLIISFLGVILYLFYPQSVDLELIEVIDYDFEQEGGLEEYIFSILGSENVVEIIEKSRNIDLPEIDFNENYLYVSGERKIKAIKFNNFGRWVSQYSWNHSMYGGKAIFSNERYPNKIFVYKSNKKLTHSILGL